MKKEIIILGLLLVLLSCQDSYDKLERYPELRNTELNLKSGLNCEDVIITFEQENESISIQLYLINSEEISLEDEEDKKSEYCYRVSLEIIEKVLERPIIYEYIQVFIVEKSNLLVQQSASFGSKILIADIDPLKENLE